MGNRGRFGKYGETKRIERLRRAKTSRPTTLLKGTRRKGEDRFGHKKVRGPLLQTRPAVPGDLAYVRDLSKRVFRRFGPYEDTLPKWFESGLTEAFMALIENRPVGFAMLGRLPRLPFSPRVAELVAIAVEPKKRRLGIGGKLMWEVIRKARSLGIETVFLHTALENLPAQQLFKRYGFTTLEITTHFYPNGQDAYTMFRDVGRGGEPPSD
jgi:ribosomal protein S18 acetylase RimI-like enzyme